MPKEAKFIVQHGERNGYLFRFDKRWFDDCQDDPSCWVDDRARAHKYTAAQIEKMRPLIEMYQGAFTVTPC